MVSSCGRHVLTFNGEIYNVHALRESLEDDGVVLRSGSDTEAILHLYARYGERLVEHLRGMYALALWDAERQALLLARDTYGIKPLYVADDTRFVRVASQVKALLAGGGIDTEPDPAGHAGFFLWGHVPEPHTLYRGIRAFPPGHTQWISADRSESPRPFASLTDALRRAEACIRNTSSVGPLIKRKQAVGEADRRAVSTTATDSLHVALADSVRAHLVADVPVGVFLSAGLDSTTLAALAAEAVGTVQTVTLGFDEYRGTSSDEVPLAEAVARHLGTDHQTVWTTRDDFAAWGDDLLDQMDQPTLDGVNTYAVSRAAAQAGLKVALSGVGGDELFGGYPSFSDIPRLVAGARFVPRALGRGLRTMSAPFVGRVASPKTAGVLEYGGDYGGAYLLRRGLFMPWELSAVLGPDIARAGWEALDARARLSTSIDGIASPSLRVTALESEWYMRNQLLRDTDWASMAHSLEVRTPLVDWTLMGAVAPLRAAHPSLGKQAMARAPQRPLPAALFSRPKTGFTVPVRDWLLTDDGLPAERGLRGWARAVYNRYTAHEVLA